MTDRRRRITRASVGARLAPLALLLVVAAVMPACEGGETGQVEAQVDKELANAQTEVEQKEQRFESLAARAAGPVVDLAGLCQDIEVFRGTTTAKALERRLEPYLERLPEGAGPERTRLADLVKRLDALEGRADAILATARAAYDAAAAAAVEDVQAKVDAAIAAAAEASVDDEDPFAPAREALAAFPQKFRATESGKAIDALRERVEKAARASDRAREVMDKANRMRKLHAHARAVGVLEGFGLIEEFQGTREAEAVAALLVEVRAEAEDAEARKAEEDKVPWIDLFVSGKDRGLPTDWQLQYGEWDVEEGALIGVAEGTKGAFIRTGADAWQDYVIELEFNIMRSGFELMLRGSINEESNRREYERVSFDESRFERSAWHRIRVEVRGDRRTALRLDTFDEVDPNRALLDNTSGGIGIFIDGEVKFRAIRVKVLKEGE